MKGNLETLTTLIQFGGDTWLWRQSPYLLLKRTGHEDWGVIGPRPTLIGCLLGLASFAASSIVLEGGSASRFSLEGTVTMMVGTRGRPLDDVVELGSAATMKNGKKVNR